MSPLHVLISGTTGWIGNALAEELIRKELRVTGVNRRNCDLPGLASVLGDISSNSFPASLEGVDTPDVAVHLAGALGWCSIEQAVDTNIAGTRRFVQAAIDKGCKRIIIASSVACIGTVAPTHPPRKLPLSADHPFEGGPWPYAHSKYAVEQLIDMMAADPANKDVEFIIIRVGATVTNPPDVRHMDGVKDGEQISWKVEPAACIKSPFTAAQPETFPEAALCSVALSDQVDCLVAAVHAHWQLGVRKLACVAPRLYARDTVPALMASWYGADVASRIDMSHYTVKGHEFDPIYDLSAAWHAIGWKPRVDLLASADSAVPRTPSQGEVALAHDGDSISRQGEPQSTASGREPVHVTIIKKVAPSNQLRWLAMASEMATFTWKEDGCEVYNFIRSKDTTDRFCIVERWASQAHLDAHFETEHFKRLVPQMDAISETLDLHVSCDALEVARPPRTTKILVLYDSATTCTAQMAELIAEGALQMDYVEVRLRTVPGPDNHWDTKQVRQHHEPASFADVYWADGVAVGSPTNLGCVSWRMKKFWDDLSQAGFWSKLDGRIGCSFSSVGGTGGGAEIVNMAMNAILMNFGFSCFGVTDYVEFKTTLHYGASVAKAPRDVKDQMACRRLGRRLAEYAAFYISHRSDAHPMLSSKALDFKRWGGVGIPARGTSESELLAMNTAPHAGPLYVPELSAATMASLPCTQPASLQDSAGKLTSKASTVTKTALLFTAMLDYVHGSTAAAASYVSALLREEGWKAIVSDDPSMLEVPTAPAFDLIVLINNSGHIFDTTREAITRHIDLGRPVMGLHACLASFLNGVDASGAAPLKPTNSLIKKTFGGHFVNHPPPQKGRVVVRCDALPASIEKASAVLKQMPDSFEVYDEFFNFDLDESFFSEATVLASLDEQSYEGGSMGPNHPVVWCHEMGPRRAKVFYCGLGHFASAYNDNGTEQFISKFIQTGLAYVLH